MSTRQRSLVVFTGTRARCLHCGARSHWVPELTLQSGAPYTRERWQQGFERAHQGAPTRHGSCSSRAR